MQAHPMQALIAVALIAVALIASPSESPAQPAAVGQGRSSRWLGAPLAIGNKTYCEDEAKIRNSETLAFGRIRQPIGKL